MAHPSEILESLFKDSSLSEIFDGTPTGHRLLHQAAQHLKDQGQPLKALEICDQILTDNPLDRDFYLLAIHCLADLGRADEALSRAKAIKSLDIEDGTAAQEIKAIINHLIDNHNRCLGEYKLDDALAVSKSLCQHYPNIPFLRNGMMEDLWRLRQKHLDQARSYEREHYNALDDSRILCGESGDVAGEIKYGFEQFYHPHDRFVHSAARFQNIIHTLSRGLDIYQDQINPDLIEPMKLMIADSANIPSSGVTNNAPADQDPAAYEKFYRLLLSCLDLNAVFGPLVVDSPLLPATFMTARGEPLTLDELVERGHAVGAEVVFSTSASAEYFARHARTFAMTHLAATDVPCLVMIYLCAPQEQLADLVKALDLDDPRLIFCSDNFDPVAQSYALYGPSSLEPCRIPINYYPLSALFRADYALKHLHCPVFTAGIDTVLQYGVSDLLTAHRDADLVVNRYLPRSTLASQLVNNLVLLYPTTNGLRFLNFFKTYLLPYLEQENQPTYLDQLGLHLAVLNLQTNVPEAKIGLFQEKDINNLIFHKDNYFKHRDKAAEYRFLNLFINATEESGNSLENRDVLEPLAV